MAPPSPLPHPCDAAFNRFHHAGFNVGVCGGLVHVSKPNGEQVLVAYGASEQEVWENAIEQARALGVILGRDRHGQSTARHPGTHRRGRSRTLLR